VDSLHQTTKQEMAETAVGCVQHSSVPSRTTSNACTHACEASHKTQPFSAKWITAVRANGNKEFSRKGFILTVKRGEQKKNFSHN